MKSGVIRVTRPNHRDFVRVLERQGPQQHRVDHAEDRAVRSDPKSQRDNGDDCEHRSLEQHPERVFEVGDHKINDEIRMTNDEGMPE